MTVEILRLSGRPGADAAKEAAALLADRERPDLSRLLVVDDTAALLDHAPVYERLLTSRRLDHLLCVAVGPRAGDGRELRFPANISGAQGSAVLWVSDPLGIDWRLAASAIANVRPGNSASGLHHLVELLSVDEVFDRVCEIAKRVPGGVASPGLRLAGADDEAASLAAALAVAARRLTEPTSAPAPMDNQPFPMLYSPLPGPVSLTEDGELSRCREQVIDSAAVASEAAAKLANTGGLGQSDARADVVQVGSALGALRERVIRLLREAHAPRGLTDKQRGQLAAVGVRLPAPPPQAQEGSVVYRAIAEAVRGGDTLPRVTTRLNLTASALDHAGSASYLPRVDQACPPELVRRLTEPPPQPRPQPWWLPTAVVLAAVLGVLAGQWNTAIGVVVSVVALAAAVAAIAVRWRTQVAAWRTELALDDAVPAADALAGLVTTVAAKEWSGDHETLDAVTRARIALDGVTKGLTELPGDPGRGPQAARAARLGESLVPGLRDLVLTVLAGATTAGGATTTTSSGGQTAFEQAKARTAELVDDWTEHARKHGALVPPPFASFTASSVPYADEAEIAQVTEAAQHDPREVMWQLCAPADLSALDASGAPLVVTFAPRLTRPPLADVLPSDTVWTSSGAHAGLLRLVPLRGGIPIPSWISAEPPP
jgi:hypothetical protein